MASQKIPGAAQGASLGAKAGAAVPGVGNAIGAGVGALLGAFSAKGGTYARTTGLRATGYVDKTGFHGNVFGLAANAGQRYQDALPGWSPLPYVSDVAGEAFAETFGDGRLDVDFIGPAEETADNRAFSSAFASFIKAQAPKDSEAGADLLAALRSPSGVIAPTIKQQAAAPLVVNDSPQVRINWPGMIALVTGAFWVVKNV